MSIEHAIITYSAQLNASHIPASDVPKMTVHCASFVDFCDGIGVIATKDHNGKPIADTNELIGERAEFCVLLVLSCLFIFCFHRKPKST